MDKRTPIYDDTIEKQLNALICKLDDNPEIITNPVEASSYLGFPMSDTEKGFLKYIKENLFDKFIAYIESYKLDCINKYAVKTNFIPEIKRLDGIYEQAEDNLYNSDIRDRWSEAFNDSTNLGTEQDNKKQIYQFFYNAASVQIFFLGKLREKLSDYITELETTTYKPEPEYFFSTIPELRKRRKDIIYDIHKNLKAEGYVDCTDEAFRKVFTIKEPKPIIWLKPQRSLTYLIKQLTGRLLVEKNKPSNYYIAERYFHIYRNGIFIHPKKLRHDKDPSLKICEFIDKVIDDAMSAYS